MVKAIKNSTKAYKSLILVLFYYSFLPFWGGISPYLFTTLLLIGLFLCLKKSSIYKYFISTKFTFDKSIIVIFLIWQMIIIIHGTLWNYNSFMDFINISVLNPYSLLAHLLPFIVLWNIFNFDYKYLLHILHIIGITAILLTLVNFKALFLTEYSIFSADVDASYATLTNLQSPIVDLFFYSAFGMFLSAFQTKKWWYFHLLCGGIALVISLLAARRGNVASWTMLLIGAYIINKNGTRSQIIKYTFLILTITIVSFYIYSNLDSSFALLGERIETDSRSFVEKQFWADLGNSYDLLWGRGLNGKYYCPMNENGNWLLHRTAIETGYCNIILNGGIISLTLYLIIMTRAAYLGWFKSRNTFTKAFSIYIIAYIIILIPFGIPSFSMVYFICWLGVSINHSNYYRNLTDNNIKHLNFI